MYAPELCARRFDDSGRKLEFWGEWQQIGGLWRAWLRCSDGTRLLLAEDPLEQAAEKAAHEAALAPECFLPPHYLEPPAPEDGPEPRLSGHLVLEEYRMSGPWWTWRMRRHG